MYGKDCDQECPPCYNGGVCHDTWGVCVCPAGFSGLNCEIGEYEILMVNMLVLLNIFRFIRSMLHIHHG